MDLGLSADAVQTTALQTCRYQMSFLPHVMDMLASPSLLRL